MQNRFSHDLAQNDSGIEKICFYVNKTLLIRLCGCADLSMPFFVRCLHSVKLSRFCKALMASFDLTSLRLIWSKTWKRDLLAMSLEYVSMNLHCGFVSEWHALYLHLKLICK